MALCNLNNTTGSNRQVRIFHSPDVRLLTAIQSGPVLPVHLAPHNAVSPHSIFHVGESHRP